MCSIPDCDPKDRHYESSRNQDLTRQYFLATQEYSPSSARYEGARYNHSRASYQPRE
jgi:hypothetical protein